MRLSEQLKTTEITEIQPGYESYRGMLPNNIITKQELIEKVESLEALLEYDSQCKQILSLVGIGYTGQSMPERCKEAVKRIRLLESAE